MRVLEEIIDDYRLILEKSTSFSKNMLTHFFKEYEAKKHLHYTSDIRGMSPIELEKILYLDLSSSEPNGQLSKLHNLTSIKALDLSYNTPVFPDDMDQLHNLEMLVLKGAGLTSFPDWICRLPKLIYLDLSNNQIPAIPPEIKFLQRLTFLNVSSNEIQALPPETGMLQNLIFFHANKNKISALPPEIGNLGSLCELSLRENELKMLPPEIGSLSRLNCLDLMYNFLLYIPEEIGKLKNLTCLNLNENRLRTLPLGLTKLKRLITISYLENPFDQMPELKQNGMDMLAPFLNKLKEAGFEHFIIKIDKELKRPVMQYLGFFPEYVQTAKRRKIAFEVREDDDNEVVLVTDKHDSENFALIKKYLSEYIDFVRQNMDEWVMQVDNRVTPTEADILRLKLENEVGRLKNAFKIAKLENKHLADENTYLRRLTLALAHPDSRLKLAENFLDAINTSENIPLEGLSVKQRVFERMNYLIMDGQSRQVVDEMMVFYKQTNHAEGMKFMVLQSAALKDLVKREQNHTISPNQAAITRAQINSALLDFIEDDLLNE